MDKITVRRTQIAVERVVEDFTTGTTQNQPSRRSATLGAEWDARVRQLVADWGADKTPELIEEMIVMALKIGRDQMGVADGKLINRSLKDSLCRQGLRSLHADPEDSCFWFRPNAGRRDPVRDG